MGARKFTDMQRQAIYLMYHLGGCSYRELAKEYNTSFETLGKILKDPSLSWLDEKIARAKAENAEKTARTMREHFEKNRTKALALIDKLLDIPDELIEASSLRDRVGAANYIKEMFADRDDGTDGTPITVNISLEDTSKPPQEESTEEAETECQ